MLRRKDKNNGDQDSLQLELVDGVLEHREEPKDGNSKAYFRALFFFKRSFWLLKSVGGGCRFVLRF